jgi:hypothetical protein
MSVPVGEHGRLGRDRMYVTATIHVLCATSSSFGSTVIEGLLAWGTFLGASTAFWSGLPAAVALLVPSRQDSLARRINWGLGVGLAVGTLLGFLIFLAFVTGIVP